MKGHISRLQVGSLSAKYTTQFIALSRARVYCLAWRAFMRTRRTVVEGEERNNFSHPSLSISVKATRKVTRSDMWDFECQPQYDKSYVSNFAVPHIPQSDWPPLALSLVSLFPPEQLETGFLCGVASITSQV
jgi:hypothetical protein